MAKRYNYIADGSTLRPAVNVPAASTAVFRTSGKDILDPKGNVFIPRGVNAATLANNGGGTPDRLLTREYADGMLAFGLNAIRLDNYVTDRHSWTAKAKALAAGKTEAQANAAVDAMVDEQVAFYLDMGFVVIMEAHDITKPGNLTDLMNQIVSFWERFARRWKHDSRVWFNTANEPNLEIALWKHFQWRCCEAIRTRAEAQNIIIIDTLDYASDVGRNYVNNPRPFGYEPEMVPWFKANYGNVVLSTHNYGTAGVYVTQQKVSDYMAAVAAENLPLIYGEVGYPVVGPSNSGSLANERNAALSVMLEAPAKKVGVFWWASNFNDNYRLVSGQQGDPLVNEFLPDANLNEAGLAFKAYVDAVKAFDLN